MPSSCEWKRAPLGLLVAWLAVMPSLACATEFPPDQRVASMAAPGQFSGGMKGTAAMLAMTQDERAATANEGTIRDPAGARWTCNPESGSAPDAPTAVWRKTCRTADGALIGEARFVGSKQEGVVRHFRFGALDDEELYHDYGDSKYVTTSYGENASGTQYSYYPNGQRRELIQHTGVTPKDEALHLQWSRGGQLVWLQRGNGGGGRISSWSYSSLLAWDEIGRLTSTSCPVFSVNLQPMLTEVEREVCGYQGHPVQITEWLPSSARGQPAIISGDLVYEKGQRVAGKFYGKDGHCVRVSQGTLLRDERELPPCPNGHYDD